MSALGLGGIGEFRRGSRLFKKLTRSGVTLYVAIPIISSLLLFFAV